MAKGPAASFLGRDRRWERCNIQFGWPQVRSWRLPSAMAFRCHVADLTGFTRTTRAALAVYSVARAYVAVFLGVAVAVLYRGTRQDVYNILWAVVFGFATLNIFSLAARRFEPTATGTQLRRTHGRDGRAPVYLLAGMGDAEPVPHVPHQDSALNPDGSVSD